MSQPCTNPSYHRCHSPTGTPPGTAENAARTGRSGRGQTAVTRLRAPATTAPSAHRARSSARVLFSVWHTRRNHGRHHVGTDGSGHAPRGGRAADHSRIRAGRPTVNTPCSTLAARRVLNTGPSAIGLSPRRAAIGLSPRRAEAGPTAPFDGHRTPSAPRRVRQPPAHRRPGGFGIDFHWNGPHNRLDPPMAGRDS